MSKTKSTRSHASGGIAVPPGLLEKAAHLMQHHEWEEAVTLLEDAAVRTPRSTGIWELLMQAYVETGSAGGLWDAVIEHLLKLRPNNPEYHAYAIDAAAVNNMPFTARHYAEHFLATWPDHEMAPSVRKLASDIHRITDEILAEDLRDKMLDADDLRLLELSEKSLQRGEFDLVRHYADQVRQRHPEAAAPNNNIVLSHLIEGSFAEAERISRETLDRQPGSIFALSQLVEALVKQGRADEARDVLAKLLRQSPRSGDLWTKMLDACHFVGDDAAAVTVADRIERENPEAFDLPRVAHYAAVALARTGSGQQAEKLWKRALKKSNQGLTAAYENLLNLQQPLSERHPAWAFPVDQWLPMPWMQELLASTRGAPDEQTATRRMARFVQKTPAFREVFIPILLQRGDPLTRSLMILICQHAGYYDLLRDFALGDQGSDTSRMDAAMILARADQLPIEAPVRMFLRGQWQEINLQGYEIDLEPEMNPDISEKAQGLIEAGHNALHEGDFLDAEMYARDGLTELPDYPVFLNYLAAALQGQKRYKEMEEVLHRTAELHPDYLFARTSMATLLAQRGDLAGAEAWLRPLENERKFHATEFAALITARIELALARKDKSSAQQWLAILESAYPSAQQLGYLRRRVDTPEKR
jgi:predicted Zn-dependent protease